MSRRSILNVIKDIKKVLEKEDQLSIKAISDKVKSQWETAFKALAFMEEMKIVKQLKGKNSYKTERLFSLINK